MKAIDRAILSHYLLDDKDFLLQNEHAAFFDGWNLGSRLATV
jgi:hypothetical protein